MSIPMILDSLYSVATYELISSNSDMVFLHLSVMLQINFDFSITSLERLAETS